MDQMTNPNASGSSWAKTLFAVTLFTEDLEATKQFYSEVFGLSVEFEGDTSVVFKIGDTLINVLKTTSAGELVEPATVAPRDAGARMVFTIHVDDVDTLCAQLTAQGVELINGPMDRPWGVRTASFKDPAGHIWEIAK